MNSLTFSARTLKIDEQKKCDVTWNQKAYTHTTPPPPRHQKQPIQKATDAEAPSAVNQLLEKVCMHV